MTRWGIGTQLFRATILFAKLAFLYDDILFSSLAVRFVPYVADVPVGIVLILLGVVIYGMSVLHVYTAFDAGRLATRGIYAVFRHPIYAAWVLFIVPGVVLLRGTPLLLTAPLAALLFYRLFIPEEERFLEERFGEEYMAYRQRVGGIVPPLRRLKTVWARG